MVLQNNVLEFMIDILKYNLIRIFPHSQEYCENHFSSSHQPANMSLESYYSHYNKIVKCGKNRFGLLGIICANISLILITLLLCIASDYFILNSHSLYFSLIINILCLVAIILKFDLLNIYDRINIIKIFYIICSVSFQSSWSCICIF